MDIAQRQTAYLFFFCTAKRKMMAESQWLQGFLHCERFPSQAAGAKELSIINSL
jgi:hypothetical protein